MRIAEVRSTSLSNGITRQMLTRSNQTSEPRLRGVIKSTPQKIQGAIVNQRPGTIIDEDGLFRKFWLPYNRFTIFKAGDQVSFIPAHDNRGAIATDVTHSTGGLKIIVPGIVKVRNKLSGLFRAILEVRSILTGAGKNVLPVAFLRDDIFNNILDSDKNKWLDFSTKLDWHTYNLAHLTGFRLWRAIDESYQWSDLPRVWKEFSDIAFAPIGGELDPLKYILRFTSHRPRDVIKFIQLCADRCNKENHFRITKATLLGVENSYSDYFKGEIIDEIHVALPEIHAIFDIFQQIGKPHIRRSEFDAAYTSKLAGDPRFKNPEHVLRILFEYSVIGQITGDKTREIFKYKNPNHSFKDLDSRTCILHRGLFRSVGVV